MKPKQTKRESGVTTAPAKPKAVVETVERTILREFAAKLGEARKRVIDATAAVERLTAVVAEGEKAGSRLQAAIAGDGGKALAALVSGTASPYLATMAAVVARSRPGRREMRCPPPKPSLRPPRPPAWKPRRSATSPLTTR